MPVDVRRVRRLNELEYREGAVLYWMARDQRVEDNWALLYAQEVALARGVPLQVIFVLRVVKRRNGMRHYHFMLRGLAEVAAALLEKNINFHCIEGNPAVVIPQFVAAQGIGVVVTDTNPLRYSRQLREAVASALNVSCIEVDAHNIVPVWQASPKEEFAAYTFRPKVTKLLPEFLTSFPALKKHPYGDVIPSVVDMEKLLERLPLDRSVEPVDWLVPGEDAAHKMLQAFCAQRLPAYHEGRNDPNEDAQSNLSPYLHYGQLSAQRVALTVREADAPKEAKEAYLEEMIVRRELSDNFCFYNRQYDRLEGAHPWAQTTLTAHAGDERQVTYTYEALEAGLTHDELWNATQRQMVTTGKMHGWCRMYWAKKILEWTPAAQTAIDYALALNDKYELDGGDPNGVVGVMWSIAGVHDRAWTERPIFGKIRYMNFAGAKRKFDVETYTARYSKDSTLFK